MTLGKLVRASILPAVGVGMLASASLFAMSTDQTSPRVLACTGTAIGTVNAGIGSDCSAGNGSVGVPAPAVIGAAPSAGTIIACHDVPGCLSEAVNSPGYVGVPRVGNEVQQSQ